MKIELKADRIDSALWPEQSETDSNRIPTENDGGEPSGPPLLASGGQIDLAGPGVDVYSSWVTPRKYNVISGTSMATPHVAGIAALWYEKTGQGALELWGNLTRASFRLRASSLDVGAGLTQAPQ
ncbi:S8 family serine peptidase [Frankia sp. CIT1]|uniref:S8 family serine peptidase n=1 Tax=Frankia sp. CIT1 TaxID=2880974 RepID=UPI00210357F4|nr:S8 family serine peptidase [Frankia sp. CIT1]